MAHIRVIHDPVGETLTVYWAEPRADQVCEETGGGVILIKDAHTHEVIGLERLYYRPESGDQAVTVEARSLAGRLR
jgi:hypothetical protein